MRCCGYCGSDISDSHRNRKYCSKECDYKARYEREGQRITPEKRKEYYKNRKKKEGYIEKLREQDKARYYAVQEYINNYKLSHGCKDCGYNEHFVALDFDHIRGEKLLNVCNAKSIAQAKKEIEKCEVVCSNCHRIRTYNRLQEKEDK